MIYRMKECEMLMEEGELKRSNYSPVSNTLYEVVVYHRQGYLQRAQISRIFKFAKEYMLVHFVYLSLCDVVR